MGESITEYTLNSQDGPEHFKLIPDFPDYFLSDMGRCYNIRTKRYVGSLNNSNIMVVGLYNTSGKRKTCDVKKLVMSMFGSPPDLSSCRPGRRATTHPKIIHRNGDPTDCSIYNLEWYF